MLKMFRPEIQEGAPENPTLAGALRYCQLPAHKDSLSEAYCLIDRYAMKEYNEGKLTEGERFYLPLEDGTKLRFAIENNELTMAQREGYTNHPIVAAGMLMNEKLDAIEAFSKAHPGLSMGVPCPAEIKDLLHTLQPGDIVSFGGVYDTHAAGGQKYPLMVCVGNDEKGVDFLECMSLTDYPMGDPTYDEFVAHRVLDEKQHLDYGNEDAMRHFYAYVKNPMTDTAAISTTNIETTFRTAYANIRDEIESSPDGIAELKVSERCKFIAHKGVEGITWYNTEGRLLDTSNVGLYLAWMKAKLVKADPEITADAENIDDPLSVNSRELDMKAYETALESGQYNLAAKHLAEYCTHYCTDVTLEIQGDMTESKYRFMYEQKQSNHIQTCVILKESIDPVSNKTEYIPITINDFAAEISNSMENNIPFHSYDMETQPCVDSHATDGYASRQFIEDINLMFTARNSMMENRTDLERYFADKANSKSIYYDTSERS